MKEATQTIVANKTSKIILSDIVLHSKNKSDHVAKLSLNGIPIIFQTPLLELTNDLRKTEHLNIYKVDLLLEGPNKNKVNEFISFIEKLESHICNLVRQNCSSWFSEAKIIQQSMITTSNSTGKNYLGLPLVYNENILYDSDNNKLDLTTNMAGKNAKIIVEISNLWIKKNQFGFVTNIKKIIVQKPHIKIVNEYVFDDSDDDINSNFDINTENLISVASDRLTQSNKSPPYLVELVNTLDKKDKHKKTRSDNHRTNSTPDDKNVSSINLSNENRGKITYKKKVEYFNDVDDGDEFDLNNNLLYDSDNDSKK